MNLEKIGRVKRLIRQFVSHAASVYAEAEADGSFIVGDRSPPPHQHGTDEGARRPAEARVKSFVAVAGPSLLRPAVRLKPVPLPPGPAFIRTIPGRHDCLCTGCRKELKVPDGYIPQPARRPRKRTRYVG